LKAPNRAKKYRCAPDDEPPLMNERRRRDFHRRRIDRLR
jgi:hypothetical protein